MKTTPTAINYGTNTRNVQLKFDEFFAEKQIPADDSVRLLDQIVEELDCSSLMRAYKRTGRPPARPPKTMLKIMIYAAMEGYYTTREIANQCERDINYIWLLNGSKAPCHSDVNRFSRLRLSECGETLFYEIVKKLKSLEEIKYEHLFVDGTKIEANANKYTFVWKKSVQKHEIRLLGKLEQVLEEMLKKYGLLVETAEELLEVLESQVKTPFVHGKGKRKSELQKDVELLRHLLNRKAKYAEYQATFHGRNSFSKTDPDSTFMHMKEDHMRNSQLKPGYNIQLGVEGEYITGIHISSERSDQLTLIPLLDTMESNLGQAYSDVTADAGYESEENYTYFENKSTECYIKPQNYERSKTKKYKSNMALRENMAYDVELDEYTCQAGKKLRKVYEGIRKSKSGFESEVTYYECDSCEGCPHKKKCTRSKKNRTLQVSKKFVMQREQSLQKITSKMGNNLRINRSIQVEGAFGVIKHNYGFRQFLTRGKEKVYVEMLLVAMGYNLNKLHNKNKQNRLRTQLFEKTSA